MNNKRKKNPHTQKKEISLSTLSMLHKRILRKLAKEYFFLNPQLLKSARSLPSFTHLFIEIIHVFIPHKTYNCQGTPGDRIEFLSCTAHHRVLPYR
jgi:hypothetical protein